MQPGINIEDVKNYNKSLREYKDKSAKIVAELEFNEQELQRQCAELSKELGIEVTPDNVEAILTERINKINNTMMVGNEILSRVKEEERNAMAQPQVAQVAQPQMAQTPQMAPQMGGFAQMPQMGQPVAPSTPQAPQMGGMDFSGGLPPIFATGATKI